jgi:hypothetical protein
MVMGCSHVASFENGVAVPRVPNFFCHFPCNKTTHEMDIIGNTLLRMLYEVANENGLKTLTGNSILCI